MIPPATLAVDHTPSANATLACVMLPLMNETKGPPSVMNPSAST